MQAKPQAAEAARQYIFLTGMIHISCFALFRMLSEDVIRPGRHVSIK